MAARKIEDTREFRRLWTSDLRTRDIAERLGVQPPAVIRAGKRFGLSTRSNARDQRAASRGKQTGDVLDRLWRQGLPVAIIAQRLGVSRWTVYNRAKRQGLTAGDRGVSSAAKRQPSAQIDVLQPQVDRGSPTVAVRACAAAHSAGLSAPSWPPALDAAVIATEGKYERIAKLARKWGMSTSRIVARWHLVRAR